MGIVGAAAYFAKRNKQGEQLKTGQDVAKAAQTKQCSAHPITTEPPHPPTPRWPSAHRYISPSLAGLATMTSPDSAHRSAEPAWGPNPVPPVLASFSSAGPPGSREPEKWDAGAEGSGRRGHVRRSTRDLGRGWGRKEKTLRRSTRTRDFMNLGNRLRSCGPCPGRRSRSTTRRRRSRCPTHPTRSRHRQQQLRQERRSRRW